MNVCSSFTGITSSLCLGGALDEDTAETLTETNETRFQVSGLGSRVSDRTSSPFIEWKVNVAANADCSDLALSSLRGGVDSDCPGISERNIYPISSADIGVFMGDGSNELIADNDASSDSWPLTATEPALEFGPSMPVKHDPYLSSHSGKAQDTESSPLLVEGAGSSDLRTINTRENNPRKGVWLFGKNNTGSGKSYRKMIAGCFSGKEDVLSVTEIYDKLTKAYPYLLLIRTNWQGIVRSNLSTHPEFITQSKGQIKKGWRYDSENAEKKT